MKHFINLGPVISANQSAGEWVLYPLFKVTRNYCHVLHSARVSLLLGVWLNFGPSEVRALPLALQRKRSVHYFWHYFSFFFLLSFWVTYFSPARGCTTVLKFCMGSYVHQYIRVSMKKVLGNPPYPPKKPILVGQKGISLKGF